MPEDMQSANVLWLHLFYHDLHTALIQARGATAAQFNRAVYERLKPGGAYVIVDHTAAVGAGTDPAQSRPPPTPRNYPSLPLDRPRRLRRHVIHHPVDSPHLVDHPRRHPSEKLMREREIIRRHPIRRGHRTQRTHLVVRPVVAHHADGA